MILACLRRGVAGIYAQKKLDELDKELGTQDWEEFIKEIKTMFSDKIKAVDTEWRIESFKQGKKNIADFIIEFKALAMKADTDELYAIFLLKKNVQQDIIKTILGYLPIVVSESLKEWKVAITSVGQGYESTKGWHNFKDGKPKCFNCDKEEHIAKDCKGKQLMKKQKIQKKSDNKDNKEKDKK